MPTSSTLTPSCVNIFKFSVTEHLVFSQLLNLSSVLLILSEKTIGLAPLRRMPEVNTNIAKDKIGQISGCFVFANTCLGEQFFPSWSDLVLGKTTTIASSFHEIWMYIREATETQRAMRFQQNNRNTWAKWHNKNLDCTSWPTLLYIDIQRMNSLPENPYFFFANMSIELFRSVSTLASCSY